MNNMVKTTLQTWLVTCLIGSLLLCVTFSFLGGGDIEGNEYLLVFGVGLGISLVGAMPAMILFGVLARALLQRMETGKARLLCSGYALLITALSHFLLLTSFHLIDSFRDSYELFLVALPYAIAFIAAIWMFRWPAPEGTEDPSLEVWPDGTIAERLLPATVFYAAAAIAGIVLVTTVVQWVMNFGSWPRGTGMLIAIGVIGTGLLITGLVGYLNKRPAGWKLLLLLSCGGLTGSVVSLLTTMGVLLRESGILPGYLLRFAFFSALDLASIILLSNRALRYFFRIREGEYRLWLLAGIGYGLVYSTVTWLLFRF